MCTSALAGQPITQNIDLSVNKSTVVKVDKGAADVIVSNPTLIDAGAIKQDQLSLTALALGDTNLLILDENGDLVRKISVHIHADTERIEKAIKEAYPNADIDVSAIGDKILLKGRVTNATEASHIRDVAQHFMSGEQTIINNMKVSGGQQVMIRVKVVEISRSILNELGIETDLGQGNVGDHLSLAHDTTDSLDITSAFGTGTAIINDVASGPITLTMRALERDGLVNTLAEPNLTAVSGENARFLAGGEFPAPSGLDSQGNLTYEYKPFGVSLSFKPVVEDNERINLQIGTEVSEVSTDLSLSIAGTNVPSFTVRRAETTVDLASGGSIMLAGIIQSKSIARLNKLPGIGSIPIIGDLVRSESFTRNETELVIMISAYLVEPIAQPAGMPIQTAMRVEPLNQALAESMALRYGENVQALATGKPFGYIME